MKKVISVILILVFCVTFPLAAYAQVDTYAIDSSERTSQLYISGTTATCVSTYSSSSGETSKVTIVQSLEKHSFLWIWNTYDGEWSKTTNGGSTALTNKVFDLPSGTYRVKSVFTLTDSSGKTETITIYSAEKTIS